MRHADPSRPLHYAALFGLPGVAVLITSSRSELAGGKVWSIDELMRDIRTEIINAGIMAKNAIPEEYDLLRTIQMTVCGYYKVA